jgi:hypothetical protein
MDQSKHHKFFGFVFCCKHSAVRDSTSQGFVGLGVTHATRSQQNALLVSNGHGYWVFTRTRSAVPHPHSLLLAMLTPALACHARAALALSRGMRVDTPRLDRRHLGTV